MTSIRVGRALLEDAPPRIRVRVGRIESTGTVVFRPRVRVGRVSSEGTGFVKVNPITAMTDLEPGRRITITATLDGGGNADEWEWRPVSGPAVGIAAAGPTVALVTPSSETTVTLVLGVRAIVDGVTSAEVAVQLTVLPQTEWWFTSDGWIPMLEVWGDADEPEPIITDPPDYGADEYGTGTYGR